MYLLDTNICVYIINRYPQGIIEKIDGMNFSEIKIPAIVMAELEYGASKSKKRETNRGLILEFVSSFDILNFNARDAEIFGTIRADLEERGELMNPCDMMIAAQAISRNYYLVTSNTEEFKRIKSLKIENWV
jgi:tRNA(fMet)-specific endonuclease VapC